MSINEEKLSLTARTRRKHLSKHHVDCDPPGSDIHMLLAFLFPPEGYREVTRERHARGDASEEGGEEGWEDVLLFTSTPLTRALSRVSLCSPLAKESLLAE